ncbi:amidohydrolase family protein [Streptomyces erythrochromogenes]|uniref:amidohydrolase family protein n=1 Tax=Streptomyces erythrochromogenes TaxID=285574 RepID=UPI0036B93C8E
MRALIEQQGAGGALWRTDGVKIFMDGTIDNGTAWLERPDCHGESTHAFWPDPAVCTRIIGELHRAGVPTATHAIGDAAVRHVLDAVEKAQAETGRGVRHRVEHIETVPDDTLRRFGELDVIASVQPTHCCDFTRADHTDNWSRRLGEERAARAWRCRDLWDSGATVVLGSDWPIAPFPPLGVMAGARPHRPGRRPAHHGRDRPARPARAADRRRRPPDAPRPGHVIRTGLPRARRGRITAGGTGVRATGLLGRSSAGTVPAWTPPRRTRTTTWHCPQWSRQPHANTW